MTPSSSPDPWTLRRQHMVDGQLRTSGVTDRAILSAFAEIARERFVEPRYASLAYADRCVPALNGRGRLMLAPATLARLIQAAGPQAGDRALDVADGSGYAATVLARLGLSVVALETPAAVESVKTLVEGEAAIEIVSGDLALGAAAKAPFDLILINGAFETSPDRLLAQLAAGGRLVGVDASFPASKAVLIESAGGAISRRALFDASAPRLEEFRRRPQFAF